MYMITQLRNKYKWAKDKMPDLVFYSGFIFVLSQAGAVLNFITNMLIVPKYLDSNEIGLIAPITEFVAFGALPLSVVACLVIKLVTRYEANEEWGKLKRLVKDLLLFACVSTLLIAIFFFEGYDAFALRMGIKSKWILFWMMVHLCLSGFVPVISLLTRSMQRYFFMAIGGFLIPLTMMVSSIFLLPVFGIIGYMVALIASISVNILISLVAIFQYFAPHKDALKPYYSDCIGAFKKYLALFLILAVLEKMWAFIPPFAVKHFLSADDAAGLFFVKRLSMIPFYAYSTLLLILLPILSSKFENGVCTIKTVKNLLVYTLLSGSIITFALYLFVPFLFEYIPQWQPYSMYAKYVWIMSVSSILSGLNGVLVSDFTARWFFKPYWYKLPISAFIVILIYILFGWGALKGILPVSVWRFIDDNIQPSLNLIFAAIIINNFIGLLINVYWYRKIVTPKQAL